MLATFRGGQKREVDFLVLELQAAVSCMTWVLGMNQGPLQELDMSPTSTCHHHYHHYFF